MTQESSMATKRCSRCRKKKLLREFYFSKGKSHVYCKSCFYEYNKERRARWGAEEWATHNAQSRDWAKRNRPRVNELARAKRKREHRPEPPLGSVYTIKSGKMKGRLGLNWYTADGKRYRNLLPKDTSPEEAWQTLRDVQGQEYRDYLTKKLIFDLRARRRREEGRDKA